MRWLLVAFVAVFAGPVLMAAPLIGMTSSPWSPWWFMGATASPPGVVPALAVESPTGPLPREDSDLMRAIQPWMVRPTPYLFGGNTLSGVDCSALVQTVYRQLGVSLPRTAQAQYDVTQRVGELQVGDLLFYQNTYSSPDRITHVAIYIGSGMQISAIEPAVSRQATSAFFWQSHYAGAGRVHWPAGNQT